MLWGSAWKRDKVYQQAFDGIRDALRRAIALQVFDENASMYRNSSILEFPQGNSPIETFLGLNRFPRVI